MTGWTGDVEDSEEEESADDGFTAKLQGFVDSGSTPEIDEVELMSNIDEVDDVSLLKQAYRQLDGNGHDEKLTIVENRLHALEAAIPEGETEQTDLTDADDSDTADSDEDNGWGGSTPDEVEESGEDVEPAEPAPEPAEEDDDQDPEVEIESAPEPDTDLSEPTEGPPEPANGLTPDEASGLERRWKVMVWGPPGLYKSHFAFTSPEPVAYIDLENKAHDIAKKFTDREIRIWQPLQMDADPNTKFRRAKKALNEAMTWLDWWHEEEGERGTIVIDSISLLWEWAQWHHKKENYPMDDPEDVELSANFGSSQESDWAAVKEYHNDEFRAKILESPYHFVWTAMASPDYNASLDDEDPRQNPQEPSGERNNVHKVDSALRARKDKEGVKVGDLTKSNYTDRQWIGLRRPTFPKFRDAIGRLEEAEATDDSVPRSELEDDMGVEKIVRVDPEYYIENDE